MCTQIVRQRLPADIIHDQICSIILFQEIIYIHNTRLFAKPRKHPPFGNILLLKPLIHKFLFTITRIDRRISRIPVTISLRKKFLDCNLPLQLHIEAAIRNAEAAITKHICNIIFSMIQTGSGR